MNAKDNKKGIDERLAALLIKKSQLQSRRSFFSKLSQVVFGVLGVSIAQKAYIFNVPAQSVSPNTAVPWQWCGLHGSVCSSGCTAPAGSGYWSHCCQDDSPCKLWHLCTYTDYCTTNPDPSCTIVGEHDFGGRAWCGNYPASDYYCTVVACGAGTANNPCDIFT